MAILYLFGLSLAQIIVFGALVFSKEPLYAFYVNAPRISPMTPLADQQIGAIIMKVGGGILFLSILVITFFRWYGQEELKRLEEIETRRRRYQSYYRDFDPGFEESRT